jgi:hypothetical protein
MVMSQAGRKMFGLGDMNSRSDPISKSTAIIEVHAPPAVSARDDEPGEREPNGPTDSATHVRGTADEFDNLSTATSNRRRAFLAQRATACWESEGQGDRFARRGAQRAWKGQRTRKPFNQDKSKGRNAQSLVLADEEDQILWHLGAAVIMSWSTIPTKLQKELFAKASSAGDLAQTRALRARIARFLHKQKDDAC